MRFERGVSWWFIGFVLRCCRVFKWIYRVANVFYKVLVRLLSGFVRFHGAPAGFYTSLRFRVKIVQGFGLG